MFYTAMLCPSRALVRSANSAPTLRLVLLVLLFGLGGGCAVLPPGSDFPKTVSTAFPSPDQTRLGRQFENSARDHGGNSGFRLLSAGVDGFLARAEMINAAERTLDLEYFIFRQDE